MQIKKLLIFLIFLPLFSFDYYQPKTFTIMLDPAGDAKDAGRTLNDSFERGITLQFAQELKKSIEANYQNVRVILTRVPGETLEFLQNANFANRLDVDFYLSIHFYKETDVRPKLYLYHYLNEPFYMQLPSNISFINYNNAHLINVNKTLDYTNKMKQILEKNNQFDFKYLLGIPFKPLVGIKAPAIALEAGLKNSNDYKNFVEPVLLALQPILSPYVPSRLYE
ncbi:MAG: N-acetylmuramoyl-L-alanine amidase [Candidatus Babeliales bacterium]|nr:N-acetylmuramoyl-L-alanine amidase [Candidatus Babeliales bacterium]